MEQAITIKTNLPVFKSKKLNEATSTIYKAVNAFNKSSILTRRTISATLALIEKDKTYRDDGFKSLAEYAETIGLDKSLAHKLENAGRLIMSENPIVRDFAAKADYSKLAILASADESEVAKAIESGDITETTTQAEVKEWKAKKGSTSKPKVLPNYTVSIRIFTSHGMDTKVYDSIAIEAVDELRGFELIKAPRPSGLSDEWTEYRIGVPQIASNVTLLEVMYSKVKPAKPDKSAKYRKSASINLDNMTDDEIDALMAQLAKRKAKA